MSKRAEEQRLDGVYRNLLMSLEKVDQRLQNDVDLCGIRTTGIYAQYRIKKLQVNERATTNSYTQVGIIITILGLFA